MRPPAPKREGLTYRWAPRRGAGDEHRILTRYSQNKIRPVNTAHFQPVGVNRITGNRLNPDSNIKRLQLIEIINEWLFVSRMWVFLWYICTRVTRSLLHEQGDILPTGANTQQSCIYEVTSNTGINRQYVLIIKYLRYLVSCMYGMVHIYLCGCLRPASSSRASLSLPGGGAGSRN